MISTTYISNTKQNFEMDTGNLSSQSEKCFKSPTSNNTFTTTVNLNEQHMTSDESDEKTFECSVCHYRCCYLSRLKRHQLIHSGEKPHGCTVCDYKCIAAQSLRIHMRTHSDKKTFECSVCDYRCRHIDTLKHHLRIHTGEEKQHACPVCSYIQMFKIKYIENTYQNTFRQQAVCVFSM